MNKNIETSLATIESTQNHESTLESDHLLALKLQNEEDNAALSSSIIDLDADHLFAVQLNEQLNAVNDVEENPFVVSDDSDEDVDSIGAGTQCDSNYYIEELKTSVDEYENSSFKFLDVKPNIETIFNAINTKCFQGALKNVECVWSKNLPDNILHKNNVVEAQFKIIMNENVLVVLPRIFLLSVLIHEMIHAYLYLKSESTELPNSHSNNFRKMMLQFNEVLQTEITTNHNYTENLIQKHKRNWWRCTGICSNYTPFYGIVHTITQPSVQNEWWVHHQTNCGGTYFKLFQLVQKVPGEKSNYKYAVHSNYINPTAATASNKRNSIKPRELVDLTTDNIVVTYPKIDIINLDDDGDDDKNKVVEKATEIVHNSFSASSHIADNFIREFKAYMGITNDRSDVSCPICATRIKTKLFSNHFDGCSGKRKLVSLYAPNIKRKRL